MSSSVSGTLFSPWLNREVTAAEIIQVGPGWVPIVAECFNKMFALGWDGIVIQIKEKFGDLRVYISDNSEGMVECIRVAEGQACRTCEVCGEPGKRRTDLSWLKTLCDEHHAENLKTQRDYDS